MKKLSLALMFVLVMAFLTGCYQGVVSSTMLVKNVEGEGTKTITCYIYKDAAVKPDELGKPAAEQKKVEDNFGGANPYILKPIANVISFLNTKAPKGLEVTLAAEDADKYTIAMTYSFTNLEDYNNKTKAIIGDSIWTTDEMVNATISSKDVDGGKEITFIEDLSVLKNSVKWAAEALLNDTTGVYNSARAKAEGLTADGAATSIFILEPFAITVGDNKTTINTTATEVKAIGFVAAPVATSVPVEKPEKNPSTGDVEMIYLFAAAASAGAITLGLRRKNRTK